MITAHNDSWLGQVPAGAKFLVLLLVSIGLYLIPSWRVLAAALVVAVLLMLSAQVPLRSLRLPLITLVIIVGLVFVVMGLQTDWNQAAVAALRLLTLCVCAYTVSLTTTFDQMLELFQRIVAPLRHVGANPAQIALGLALAIRFIPELKRIYVEVREAQHARGLGNNPLAVSVPLVIRALRVADETAEALDARGYDSVEAGQQARTRPQRHA